MFLTPSVHMHVLYVFLFKCIFNTRCWFIIIEPTGTAHSSVTHALDGAYEHGCVVLGTVLLHYSQELYIAAWCFSTVTVEAIPNSNIFKKIHQAMTISTSQNGPWQDGSLNKNAVSTCLTLTWIVTAQRTPMNEWESTQRIDLVYKHDILGSRWKLRKQNPWKIRISCLGHSWWVWGPV